ncbi:hypothetical protein H2248_004552 [Termitomyces sp. 'cryptogamus']|nr:hypothetical protein H2248_004552 [Termitomyces sp. 'cryptogamus']
MFSSILSNSSRGCRRALFRAPISSSNRRGTVHINSHQTFSTTNARKNSPSSSSNHAPNTILIVNKLRTPPVILAINAFLEHVQATYPWVRVFHENRIDIPHGAEVWTPGLNAEKIDLVVTLGGDGTILHASSLFSAGAVPPVLSFSMGTLGFLLPFHIDDFAKALESVFLGKATILNRMRLACTFYNKDLEKKGNDGDGLCNSLSLTSGAETDFRLAGYE